ncbi:trypsin-like serine protease [Hymenobacter cellulosivorans]|uniref:Trypsin-like serine protease n=1 Tax=Hymenobacter cellulosivorans TaxID=2932249 RepID=A0ABY4FCX1_9BACT|nr:trypsin-like peptidase domain-containing protein [Hymenobacter cellulosivorans]UOQ54519.1 trypsin-like serine protease [Hymenobacter cellulosivorans]
MKFSWLLPLLLLTVECSGQETVSQKTFPDIALTNQIDFTDPQFDQARFSCGFLLKHHNDTVAVTAKHLLKVIKTKEMNTVSFGNSIKAWSLFSLSNKGNKVVTKALLNENKAELLEDKATYDDDWLVFSLSANHTAVKPLEARSTPLTPGEKLYVVGWTRKMEAGPQRVYEFEYYKTIDHRLLLKDLIVPEQFGGLSGAPVVDEQGLVVGIVSNSTMDPATKKKYFSPCALDGLLAFLETNSKK